MAVTDLFSKRSKRARGEYTDVYQYSNLPSSIRHQIVQIFIETLGDYEAHSRYGKRLHAWQGIVSALRREYGVPALYNERYVNDDQPIEEISGFILGHRDIEQVLDAVELGCRCIDRLTRDPRYLHRSDANGRATEAIEEINIRFREHALGFEYASGEIIRKDSQLIHEEAVKPALRLLQQPCYSGAEEEFLSAHAHYRQGNNKEALNECLKAFESMMKAICDIRGWEYAVSATASKLIQVLFENELVPAYWQQSLTSLRSTLESSVPTGRNRLSGHGQGSTPIEVPDHLTAYMLHMTASCLVFLAQSNAALDVAPR
ncbi:STM4504/CBY_0614 family protein [Pseudomonas machongensis]